MTKQGSLQLRITASSTIALILFGTLFYRHFEGWSLVDSFYFTVITLTTVGYGDLSPTTDITKIVTVFFIIFGISVLASFINIFGKARLKRRVRRKKQRVVINNT